MTVVVNYEGPFWLKTFCESREIAIFDRVSKIELDRITAKQAGLTKDVVSNFRHLNEVKALGGSIELRDENVATLKKEISKCRLVEIEETSKVVNGTEYPSEVVAKVALASASFCCAEPETDFAGVVE